MATSFVSEVLASAGLREKDDLNAKLGQLSKRTEEVKVEVYNSLQKRYGDFYPYLNTAIDLNQKVKNMSEEMESMSVKIEKEVKAQLNVSTTEFKDLSAQLEETNTILSIMDKLVCIHDALQTIEQSMTSGHFVKAAESLECISHCLEQSNADREGDIKILKTLQEKYQVQKARVISELSEVWSRSVKWTLPKKDTDSNRVALSISSGKEAKRILTNTVQAMHKMDVLDSKLKLFGNSLMKYIFRPFVMKGMVVQEESMPDIQQLTVFKEKQSESRELKDIIAKIYTVLLFLNKHLLGIAVDEEQNMDDKSKGSVTLMQKVGEIISADFLDLLIKECLAHSIPTSNKELEKYHLVINMIEKFQAKLVESRFIYPYNNTIVDYVKNVNVLFANKKCQEILEKARGLMTADLHNTIKVSEEAQFGELPSLGQPEESKKKQKTVENTVLASNTKLSASTFRHPTCQISQAVQSLMLLVYETLHEASSSKPQCAIQLFYATRNVFELFCNVVPTYHKQPLTDLPLVSALHHNNCMYMAHHLLMLGHQFRPKLPDPLAKGAATYVDLVPKLRRLGTECFLQQMTNQKNQMIEYLHGAHGFISLSEDDNFVGAERAVKQALHQLRHLGSVWRDVLPINIYNKAIGTLLNAVILEITNSITLLEDISADDATQLYSLLSLVVEKSPELFSNEENQESVSAAELYKHVAKWMKFKELMLLLNASLQEISDRWADGKGPLAHEFGANEVKQLVRALFQNTDRRAAVLAKIK